MEDHSLRPMKRPKSSAPVTVIVCIVFGLLSFVFALCSGALFSVRNILSESALSSAVGKINPADWEIGMFLGGDELDNFAEAWYLPKNKIDEDSTIAEIVSDSAFQYGLRVTTIDIVELMEESGVMPAIGELFGNYERYILTGEDEEPFSRTPLMAKIKAHRSEIQSYTGIDISIFYDEIENTLRENTKDLSRLNPSELMNGAGKYTKIALSQPVIFGCFAMSVVMMALALLITKRPGASAGTLGIVFTVAGAALITISLLIPTMLAEALTTLRPSAVRYITTLLNASISPILLRNGAVLSGLGLLLIVISIVCAVISKKIISKKAEEVVQK